MIAFKSFSSVFHYVEENCTNSQSGPEVNSATWTTVTEHNLYYDHDHKELKPYPTAVSSTATACERKEVQKKPRNKTPSARKAAQCLFYRDTYNPDQQAQAKARFPKTVLRSNYSRQKLSEAFTGLPADSWLQFVLPIPG